MIELVVKHLIAEGDGYTTGTALRAAGVTQKQIQGARRHGVLKHFFGAEGESYYFPTESDMLSAHGNLPRFLHAKRTYTAHADGNFGVTCGHDHRSHSAAEKCADKCRRQGRQGYTAFTVRVWRAGKVVG